MNLGGVIHLNKTGLGILLASTIILFIYMLTSSSKDNNSSVKINLKDLLRVAIRAAENGGKEIILNKDNPKVHKKGLTKEGLEDRVTSADFRSHCAMTQTLKYAFPTLNIVSEEESKVCDNSDMEGIKVDLPALKDEFVDIKDVTVWVDPLDATYEFTEKLFDYVTTMVCVAVKNQPIIGVIHKPFSQQNPTFWAWVDHARSENLKNVKSESNRMKIIVSLSHSGQIKKVLSDNFKDYELVMAAGAGYKSLEVATGKADAYLHITAIKKWDICAGNAIIKAMGGKMTTKYNDPIDYAAHSTVENNKGVVATMTNHEQFIGKLG